MVAVTQALARFVAQSRFDAMPAVVRHEGVRAFVNWIGCAAGGAREDNVERMLGLLQEFNGKPVATVVGRRERLDVLNATFINSMSSGALTFNDTHYATVAHPTSPVAAALLALAERQPVSGREFVHALILGDEIQCRVGNMLVTPPASCQVGWSMAGLTSGIGSAVAAAKVLGLDEAGTTTAIGHAANQACGLREAHGTMASQFTAGHAARCGVQAALLAARGFTCAPTMLEGVKGFAQAHADHANPEAAIAGLGSNYEILTLAYKPYPSGFVIHPVIDACLEIAERSTHDVRTVERIEIWVNPLALELCNRPKPATANQALVSVQHWVAVSLTFKAAGVEHATEAMTHDARLAGLRARVVANVDPSLGREAARVRVSYSNGATAESAIAHCVGSAGNPMSDDHLTRKTRGQLSTAYDPEAAESILAASWKIESYDRVDGYCKLLVVH